MQLVFLGPLLLAMASFPVAVSRTRWFAHCIAVLALFVLAASPLLLLNTMQFGHPLSTGYSYWVPEVSDRLFSLHNLPRHAAMIWSEVTAQWHDFRVANLSGTGTYFVFPFVLLAIVGLFLRKPDRFQFCALLACLCFLIGTATYLFVDGRFYIPLLFLLVTAAVLPVSWAFEMIMAKKHRIAALIILGLFLLACLGYPSASGYKPKRNRLQAWDALQFGKVARRSDSFEAEQSLIQVYGKQPGIVLSTVDPVFLNALLPPPFVAAPLDGKHHYAHSKRWRYGQAEAIALVRRGLANSMPVYGLFSSKDDFTRNSARLPVLDGYQWMAIPHTHVQAVILQLTAVAPAS
jgi:hypothetical protein